MSQKRALFPLGQVVATPGAIDALNEAEQSPIHFLERHQTGDWSEMVEEDQAENRRSVEKGLRIFSSYKMNSGKKLWVITEWNRMCDNFASSARILIHNDMGSEMQFINCNWPFDISESAKFGLTLYVQMK